jgi:SNF2-related domain
MKIESYRFKRKPWAHQREALARSWDAEAFALFMEQGTGKTKVAIDTSGALYVAGKIDAVMLLSRDGVQKGWIRDALPEHMSPAVPYRSGVYANRLTVRDKRIYNALWADTRELRFVAITWDLLNSAPIRAEARRFLRTFRTLLIGDESHNIGSPKAGRTKAAIDLSAHAKYRRILTGTPSTQSPFELWSQFHFLDENILGQSSFTAFKSHYGVMLDNNDGLMRHLNKRLQMKYGAARAAKMTPQVLQRDEYNQPVYKNLDELNRLIQPYSYRVLKKDCLDLPAKVYKKRYVEMLPEQRRLYEQLRDDFYTEYEGGLMTAPLAITRYQRLQQILGGFWKRDTQVEPVVIGGDPLELPKIVELLDIVQPLTGKVLVWANYQHECEAIARALEGVYGGGSVARYWGGITNAARSKQKALFIGSKHCRFFVSNPGAGGEGLDGLQVADTEVYYSNGFSLRNREQSEDRAHRGGSEAHESVTIYDIVVPDSLDEKTLRALRMKKDVSTLVIGDDPKEWL